MRVVIQRVKQARVEVDGQVTELSGRLASAVGNRQDRFRRDAEYLVEKVLRLRIFPDSEGKMNRNVEEAAGSLLVVSQFTLYGDCRKGRRPSFDLAASPEQAARLYEYFVNTARKSNLHVETGVFQASVICRCIW
jgi:D-tyrosyl-tRNA(Tyr) deacylase